jgi:hypothetical protein
LSGRGLCDYLITPPEEPTDCGASLCVIKKPRGLGGHSPRWAAVPKMMKMLMMMMLLIIIIIIIMFQIDG